MKKTLSPRHAVQTALCGLFYFCLAAAPLRAPAQTRLTAAGPGFLKELFMPGIRSEVWTVKGEAMWLDGIRLSTPPDFSRLAPNDPIARFSAETALPGGDLFFGRIQKMVLGETATAFLGSTPQQMEYYRLGDVRNAVPPPPDWQRSFGQIPPWHRAAEIPDATGLPFLNHAAYCWNGRAGSSEPDPGVYLFRQNFRLDPAQPAIRATLRLATNVDLIEAAFNEHPLHLVGASKPSQAEFEVTPLLRPGDNILALKVRARSGGATNYGLAFHLEVTRLKGAGARAAAAAAQRPDPAAALAIGRRGDRVFGTVTDLNEKRIQMTTTYGEYSIDWDDCKALLFPAGWRKPQAARRQGLREKFFPGAAQPTPAAADDLTLYGLPVTMKPDRLHDCILLTEGRVVTAKPSDLGGGQIYFEGAGGKQIAMAMSEVVGIFPPTPEEETFRRPPREVSILYCQVSTRTGEAFNGLLRQISPDAVVVESEGGRMMTIKSDNVASIQFPYHSATLSTDEARKGPIGVLAQAGDLETSQTRTYDRDVEQVEGACFVIGAESKDLTLEQQVSATLLRPDRTPVLVSVDPAGAYMNAWFGSGDAQAALEKYVSEGGVLVALSRGGALRTALQNEGGGKLKTVQPAPGLAELFGLRASRDAKPTTATAPAAPDLQNEASGLFFQRDVQAPEGLGALPRRIEMATLESASFAPLNSGAPDAMVVYTLADASGKSFGPALTITPHSRGWVIFIDSLLWESRIDGRPFTEIGLPVLLKWAVANAAH